MTAQDAFSLAEGVVFHDQYEVVRRIDSGAMGAVYEVVDRRTKRRRALKVMLARFVDNADVTERFRREATITADVVSEHIVETYDAGVDKVTGLPFLVMELLRGEDVGKLVARGPLLAEDVVTLLMHAASALDKTHASGVVHRDLKPENMFVTRRDDGAPRLKILDFGIAKVIEKSATSATSTRNMGTPVYMSPEQVIGDGNVGPAADLYALGHLAYTMLVGEPYWLQEALSYETVYPLLLRIMQGATEAASTRAARNRKKVLPPEFDAWFAKATAHAPDERFKTAVDSIVALSHALAVPRPPLPSSAIDLVTANAPTAAPPRKPEAEADTEEPLLLIPAAARLPRQDEPTRTLSPVSTRPDLSEAAQPAEKTSRRRGLFIGLGAAFFAFGVVITVVFARPARPPQNDDPRLAALPPAMTAEASTGTAGPPAQVPTAVTEPSPTTTATATEEPPAEAPLGTTSGPAPSVAHPLSATKKPVAAIKPAKQTGPKTGKLPARTYGDPSRDL